MQAPCQRGLRQPFHQSLVLTSAFLPAEAEQPEGYYARVSEEVGLIVQGSGERRAERLPGPTCTDGVGECCTLVLKTLWSGICPRAEPVWNSSLRAKDAT